MDYKYIEQLLERYWECATSPEEESILRTFFSQNDVPAELAPYKDLFDYERLEADNLKLGADFDEKLFERLAAEAPAATGERPAVSEVFKARRINRTERLAPLYRAAAAVAVVMIVGSAAQHSFSPRPANTEWDYNTAAYKDSYQDPRQAYEAGVEVLQLFREGPQTATADSARIKQKEKTGDNAVGVDIEK